MEKGESKAVRELVSSVQVERFMGEVGGSLVKRHSCWKDLSKRTRRMEDCDWRICAVQF